LHPVQDEDEGRGGGREGGSGGGGRAGDNGENALLFVWKEGGREGGKEGRELV
jgi:hypothetical protein